MKEKLEEILVKESGLLPETIQQSYKWVLKAMQEAHDLGRAESNETIIELSQQLNDLMERDLLGLKSRDEKIAEQSALLEEMAEALRELSKREVIEGRIKCTFQESDKLRQSLTRYNEHTKKPIRWKEK